MDPAVLILKHNILDNPMETTLLVLLAYCFMRVLFLFWFVF